MMSNLRQWAHQGLMFSYLKLLELSFLSILSASRGLRSLSIRCFNKRQRIAEKVGHPYWSLNKIAGKS